MPEIMIGATAFQVHKITHNEALGATETQVSTTSVNLAMTESTATLMIEALPILAGELVVIPPQTGFLSAGAQGQLLSIFPEFRLVSWARSAHNCPESDATSTWETNLILFNGGYNDIQDR